MEDDYTRDWEVRSPIGVLGNLMDTLMVKPAPLFAAETLAVIDEFVPTRSLRASRCSAP